MHLKRELKVAHVPYSRQYFYCFRMHLKRELKEYDNKLPFASVNLTMHLKRELKEALAYGYPKVITNWCILRENWKLWTDDENPVTVTEMHLKRELKEDIRGYSRARCNIFRCILRENWKTTIILFSLTL